MPDACGSCKAPVIFAWTPAGALAIIDVDPVEDGNVMMLRQEQFGVLAVTLSAVALERARDRGVKLRKSHWATCPDREEWRRKQAAKKAERVAGVRPVE